MGIMRLVISSHPVRKFLDYEEYVMYELLIVYFLLFVTSSPVCLHSP
jgi:hypothetical protein